MKILLATALVYLLAGLAPPAGAIITRHDLEDKDYQWRARDYHFQQCYMPYPGCDATLIASRWVLTAGPCVGEVKLGTHVFVANNLSIADTAVICPDGQNGPGLALIHLTRPVTWVEPVPIYRDLDELSKEVVFLGHGSKGTGLTGSTEDDPYVRAATNIVDEVTDQWLKFTFDEPGSKNVTALEGVGGAGDTGGPALYEKDGVLYVLGVYAWEQNTAIGLMPGYYGVKSFYVRLSKYVDWITSTLEEWGDELPDAETKVPDK